VLHCTATHHQHTLSSRPTPTTPRTPYAVYVRNYNIYWLLKMGV